MNEIVPTNVLAKQGVTAVGGLAGGLGLLILGALPSVFGIAAGIVIGLVGVGALSSRERSDRVVGGIAAAAGGLAILSKVGLFGGLASGLLGIATVGLLGLGVWNGIKFLKGLKSRA